MKTLPTSYGELTQNVVAVQIKNFIADNINIRKLTEPALMKSINEKWKNTYADNIDDTYNAFIKQKNKLIINVIPENKQEFKGKEEDYKKKCRYLNIKEYNTYREFEDYIKILKQQAGYK